jgi:hypothetical protein
MIAVIVTRISLIAAVSRVVASGAEATFRPPVWWLGIGLLLIAALTGLTMYLFRTSGSHRFRALILTVAVAVGVPVMMFDRIVVSGTEIEETGGLVTPRGFNYAQVEYVRLTTRPGPRNRRVRVAKGACRDGQAQEHLADRHHEDLSRSNS